MLPGICSGQFTAADYATNSTYSGSWSAGQNGGFGFGAWSFNSTDPTPGGQQTMSSALPLGRAWTLFNNSSTAGISIAGRSINGGLQPGQTLETVINNPTSYHFFRGWDIAFFNGTDNRPAGNNNAGLFMNVFGYFNGPNPNWSVTDAGGGKSTPLSSLTTGTAGMKVDLTLSSATTYSLIMTPLSNPGAAYSQTGTLAESINYIQFRLYNNASAGPNDTANNFGISYMTIVPEPSDVALIGLGFSGLLFLLRRKALENPGLSQ
jgi:hypothetical protein